MESGKVFKTEKYYFFWGICTVAVVLGQVYVGSGYRQMSNSIFTAIETWDTKQLNSSVKFNQELINKWLVKELQKN